MPTYSYRCLHCGETQSVFQNFHEIVTPACADCGGFTEKIINQAPMIIKSGATQPPVTEAKPSTDPHECGSACVLHRKSNSPSSPVEPDA